MIPLLPFVKSKHQIKETYWSKAIGLYNIHQVMGFVLNQQVYAQLPEQFLNDLVDTVLQLSNTQPWRTGNKNTHVVLFIPVHNKTRKNREQI